MARKLQPPADPSYIVQIFTSEDVRVAEGAQRGRGEVSKGFDDGLSKAFELALTPAVLGVAGWWLDDRLGLTPLLTLLFCLLGVVGTSLSLWYRYDAAMKVQESAAADARAARTPRRRSGRPEAASLTEAATTASLPARANGPRADGATA